jgi:pimeloyl-ACP methyl ester carboxylesterase
MIKFIIYLAVIFSVLLQIVGCAHTPYDAENATISHINTKRWIRHNEKNDTVIIFVHGVIGNAYDTWLNHETKAYWPQLIADDEEFASCNIYAYEYGSPSVDPALTVSMLASEMKARLLADGVLFHQRIVFVVHSMGGLVTRQFLLREREGLSGKKLMIYFLGTPTTGSPAATLASIFSFNPQFKNIKPASLDSYLANAILDWQASAQMKDIPSFCAYETQPIGSIIIVPFESATNLCNEALLPIPANHIQLAKPSGRSALQYIGLRNAYKSQGALVTDEFGTNKPTIKQVIVTRDNIVPKLQIKPIVLGVIDSFGTILNIEILNYSDYVAKKIHFDIKFGDHTWKYMTEKVKYQKSMPEFDGKETELELKPGNVFTKSLFDINSDCIGRVALELNGKPFVFKNIDDFPISQDWRDDLKKINNGGNIKITIKADWENEFGRRFDKIIEYNINIIRHGSITSYTFIPTGNTIENN